MSENIKKPISELEAELRSVNEQIDELVEELEAEAVTEEERADSVELENVDEEAAEEEKDEEAEEEAEEKAEDRAQHLIDKKEEILAAIETAKAEAEARKAAAEKIINGDDVVNEIKVEESKVMNIAELRKSEEYMNAYANYIKTGDEAECRALLTLNAVDNGSLPVPEIVEGYIRTAWENEGIMSLVEKSYIRGNIRVGFEAAATDAEVHEEGGKDIDEETLLIGVVELVAQSLKKWITVSDEALDLNGQEFLDYLYDEIAQKIAKLAADILIDIIATSPAVSTDVAPAVATIAGDVAPGTIIKAEALLSDEAREPVVVMNKQTYGAFKSLTTADGYLINDPFDGMRVVFNNSLPAFSAADEGKVYAIVGDFGTGARANFPNGDEIKFKFDDLSLAEKDLVKIVGRMYVALGVVAPFRFTTITKPVDSE